MLLLTQSQYAAHRGIRRQSVFKMVKAGKIEVIGPRKLIDAAAADRALGEARERVSVNDYASQRDPPVETHSETTSAPPASLEGLTKWRAQTESYNCRIKQLEFEERIGQLVRTADVERSMMRCAESIVRDFRHATETCGGPCKRLYNQWSGGVACSA